MSSATPMFSEILIRLNLERYWPPLIILSVMYLGDCTEETTTLLTGDIAVKVTGRQSKEKLNHFKLPGCERSLNEQHNANVWQIGLSA